MISPRDLASIRQRLAGSAPAPWVVERDASGARRIRTAAAGARKEIVIWRDFEPAGDADVEFIALARNLMDKLVEAADRRAVDIVSQEELDRLEAAARQATAGPVDPRPGRAARGIVELHPGRRGRGASRYVCLAG